MDDEKHFPIWYFIVVAVIVLGLESSALAPRLRPSTTVISRRC